MSSTWWLCGLLISTLLAACATDVVFLRCIEREFPDYVAQYKNIRSETIAKKCRLKFGKICLLVLTFGIVVETIIFGSKYITSYLTDLHVFWIIIVIILNTSLGALFGAAIAIKKLRFAEDVLFKK